MVSAMAARWCWYQVWQDDGVGILYVRRSDTAGLASAVNIGPSCCCSPKTPLVYTRPCLAKMNFPISIVWAVSDIAEPWIEKALKIKVLRIYIVPLREGIKKNKLVFFRKTSERGAGGSRPIRNFLIRKKLRFFWIFFKKGWGLTYSKRVLS